MATFMIGSPESLTKHIKSIQIPSMITIMLTLETKGTTGKLTRPRRGPIRLGLIVNQQNERKYQKWESDPY